MRNFFSVANWKRRLSQLFFLTVIGEWSFYGLFRCPYAVPYLGCDQCPVIQCPGRAVWMWGWAAILASGLLFGRAFCGWACPGGLVAEVLAAVSALRIGIAKGLDRHAAHLKLGVLAASLYTFLLLNNPRWAVPIRTGDFFPSVALTFEHADHLWLVRTGFILTFFLVGGLIIPRLWCRFLCPTGGLLAIGNRFAPIRVQAEDACTKCEACRPTCPVDTTPGGTNCINCGICLSACPQEAVRYTRPGRP